MVPFGLGSGRAHGLAAAAHVEAAMVAACGTAVPMTRCPRATDTLVAAAHSTAHGSAAAKAAVAMATAAPTTMATATAMVHVARQQ